MKKIIISTLAISAIILTGCTQQTPETNLDEFAKCLTEKWAMIYTTQTCGYCQKQKAMFGDSFQYINNVDCNTSPTVCTQAGIQWVPNRKINGEDLMWLQTLEVLAEKTGCEI